MAWVVNPLPPDGSSARAAPAASSRNMSPEIGDTDMLDPIVRAAAHPSRAILGAPARRYRLSETGNMTANGSSSIRRAKCDIAEVKHAIQLPVAGHDDPHGRNRRRAARRTGDDQILRLMIGYPSRLPNQNIGLQFT